MFSGIIEEIAVCESFVPSSSVKLWDGSVSEGAELTVKVGGDSDVLSDAYIGCSIAVNGVCLTATNLDKAKGVFTAGLAPETLRRSNLGALSAGDSVNIERALKADGRNSGHFVQGHVDCTGKIIEKFFEKDSLWIRVSIPKEYIKFVVPKGFIAIDGTSLTICDVDPTAATFTFMLIAHTQQHVIIPKKNIGDFVNVEVDVLAKLVAQSLGNVFDRLERLEKAAKLS
jgi:riboflavin synthase